MWCCWHPKAEPVQNPQGWQVPRRARDYAAAPAGLRFNRRANRAPSGRTVFSGSAPRGAATPPSLCGQPFGLADSRFEPLRGDSTAGALAAPLRFVPFCSAQSGNPHWFLDSPAASWTEAALMLSGPERTRGTEPRWGKASAYSRATRLPAPAGGAKNELPPGAPSSQAPRREARRRRRIHALSPAG